jgi:aminoglycoside phosphotransferase (APT) family kinase protein
LTLLQGFDMEANLESLATMARDMGLAGENDEPVVEILGGGISNIVGLVKTRRGAWIFKQALGQLRVKDEWLADRSRIYVEVACLRVLHDLVRGSPAPSVVLEDRSKFVCILEYAGEGSRTWKRDLLLGLLDQSVTNRVASVLYEFHSATWGKDDMRVQFGDASNFKQLRLDPYLATVAQRHPDIRSQIEEVTALLVEEKLCVVHGDFSPKNILLLSDGRIWVIDCEAAHYGNPVFDVAFCVNHLLLKAVHLKSTAHLKEADRFWSSYWSAMKSERLERQAVRTLAALMLARVDGKSPVEYLDNEDSAHVRRISRELIASREDDFTNMLGEVSRQLGSRGKE